MHARRETQLGTVKAFVLFFPFSFFFQTDIVQARVSFNHLICLARNSAVIENHSPGRAASSCTVAANLTFAFSVATPASGAASMAANGLISRSLALSDGDLPIVSGSV
jgi:hypothetical protein